MYWYFYATLPHPAHTPQKTTPNRQLSLDKSLEMCQKCAKNIGKIRENI